MGQNGKKQPKKRKTKSCKHIEIATFSLSTEILKRALDRCVRDTVHVCCMCWKMFVHKRFSMWWYARTFLCVYDVRCTPPSNGNKKANTAILFWCETHSMIERTIKDKRGSVKQKRDSISSFVGTFLLSFFLDASIIEYPIEPIEYSAMLCRKWNCRAEEREENKRKNSKRN